MHLIGRMWGVGENCPSCKTVTGTDFRWFSRPYGLPWRDERPPLHPEALQLLGFLCKEVLLFLCFGGRFWLE